MKKLKLLTVVAAVSAFSLSFYGYFQSEASVIGPVKKIMEIPCFNNEGFYASIGTLCVQGGGNCAPNPCPDGTNQ
jgi:hypothetical protein